MLSRARFSLSLLVVIGIAAARLSPTVSADGAGAFSRYEQVRPSASGHSKTAFRLKVKQSTIVGFGVVVPLHYRNEPLAFIGTGKILKTRIPIDPRSGRFRRVVRGSGVETLKGRFVGGRIVGRYSFVTKNGYSGRSFADPWVRFRATEVK